MKRTFVDTSGLYALLDEDDEVHTASARWMQEQGAETDRILVTHAFVAVETAALVHRRLGTGAVRVLLDAWLPALSVFQVDPDLFDAGIVAYRAGVQRGTSLVDHVSFEHMRRHGVTECFGFDNDFRDEGFSLVPSV